MTVIRKKCVRHSIERMHTFASTREILLHFHFWFLDEIREFYTYFLQFFQTPVHRMWKSRFLAWKCDFFLYNPAMSWFKTHKLSHVKSSFFSKIFPFSTKHIDTPGKKHTSPTMSPSDTTQTDKKHFSWKKLFGIFLLCCIGGLTVYASKLILQTNTINGSDHFTPVNTIITEEGKTYTPAKLEGTYNLLIAGIGGKWHEGADLTDSLMLASLDATKKRVTLLSLPRDLYVAYPLNKWTGRINSLYDLGKRNNVGVTYLAQKVSEITGQSIDYFLVIDFAGFKKIIDILGGVDVNVPKDLVDREYPNNNWGYETFSVQKWPQTFDGETALKYARSRHSTSDFDRSERQQVLLKAIKEKASSLGIITNPSKISEIYNALKSNIDTNLSVAEMGRIALGFAEVKSDDILISNLSDSCLSVTKCTPGSFLYAPSRELFGGSAVIIPENATVNKLSYYTDIRRYTDVTFRYPKLSREPHDIVIVYDPSVKYRAKEIAIGLAKYGFPLALEQTLTAATGSIEKSHINIYWHEDLAVGINPLEERVQALKYFEEWLTQIIVTANEYRRTNGPKIEIVLWKDAKDFFQDIKYPYYIPFIPKSTISWTTLSVSWTSPVPSAKPSPSLSGSKKTPPSSPPKTVSWENSEGWEDF